jgi:hypothetical protein
MLCQGDAMKKCITFKVAVMTTIPLMVTIVVASFIPDTKKM